ncbi:MAG: hypothetical protein RL701_2872 [Pseudomonadota bacterium]
MLSSGCVESGGENMDGASVDDNKLLPKLTDADAVALCEFKHELGERALQGANKFCTYLGAHTSKSTDDCKQSRDRCLSDKLYDQQEDGILHGECRSWLASDFGVVGSTRCTATVAELKKCWSWAIDQSVSEMEKASCDSPGSPSVSLSTGPCGDLRDICPGYSLLM